MLMHQERTWNIVFLFLLIAHIVLVTKAIFKLRIIISNYIKVIF